MTGFAKNSFAIKIFQKALGVASWVQKLPWKMTPPPMRLIQFGTLYWQSRVLYVAVKLDIASLLGDRQLNIEELAAKAGCHPDSLYRLLRMLISMGVFSEPVAGTIVNNEVSIFLDKNHPQSVRSMILMHNSPEITGAWIDKLEEGVRSGDIPFRLAHGDALFDYMEKHSDFGSLFATAMDTTEALVGNTFINDFNWNSYERLIDIGGSKGSKSIAILKEHPHLKAVVFDLPEVVAQARSHWQGKVDESILQRMEFVAGDAREQVPAASGDKDVYMLCAVLHGLGNDEGAKILNNIRHASGSFQSDVIIMDAVLKAQHESLMLTSFDMQMLIGTEGRERTRQEWSSLCTGGGYRIEQIFDTRSLWKLLLLRAK